ncbi:hypothetical protein H6P81_004287 [Aristolochia fimbriata]|uniref:Uncharacterized protein n=1 Tax=Aristolochia fimbriata TaxID=158543 RepID=A0AAV7FFH1_ARIFI|nr:hypothetical protein H6P81_004287 [Aristolochia fimbriata]
MDDPYLCTPTSVSNYIENVAGRSKHPMSESKERFADTAKRVRLIPESNERDFELWQRVAGLGGREPERVTDCRFASLRSSPPSLLNIGGGGGHGVHEGYRTAYEDLGGLVNEGETEEEDDARMADLMGLRLFPSRVVRESKPLLPDFE